ncbi:uncharacterized protein OCT59_005639 [Rhizophagus irregularis]|jgi:hypothetical protein|uniref:Ribosomal protein s17 n=3 Tax=Rhizophagus irregularis TaxID=588596 RepID=A0A916E0G4_9GLOM|nr:hypothetical protein GLOIN_2v1608947 [Rhizophagus irregularis DAOM 181602=DAOM 197198]EXX78579.1 hypothetical protein RirG_013740 [Rhizophagus irregularis DAOM 197198w]UZO14174.1 hypothetical protein OCT59_005639 [Rhizophagus irregularis]POG71135.1 hypothetical protein GLOIN_2v1608947 [Rhizophagus irregularis DAOM 181602=DAOM 197198]CAB4468524.1 unnamed protein product [Rhizophagus irregularis]CAB5206370.1 unnamed protein product [Rhizophagus irregularis]|eukprot:XP_025178001.1 hypothetical protein GLOIN_2v1608947 [Rhizophagus irregularis DAOM 181602=DAOM 197198]
MKFYFAVALLLAVASLANAVDTIKPLKPSAFCIKSKLTPGDGTQLKQPSCVSLEIGEIPATNKMVSALIVNPKNNQAIKRNTPFTVDTKVIGLSTGFFSDPAVDYYQIQQTLDGGGQIQGHSHITIQKIDGNNAPDPTVFAFFKGLNDAAKNGVLSVNVDTGLPQKGTYRICTMNSSNSHQPVVMPVAQRGAQDDCVRINVI